MSPATMPQLALRLGINVEQVGFAARLGRLPEPLGRDADGLLLFDADTINLRPEQPEPLAHSGLSR